MKKGKLESALLTLRLIFVAYLKGFYQYILLLILICTSSAGFAQITDGQRDSKMEEVIESVAESDESDIDNSVMLETMTENAEHPVSINLASEDDLNRLNLLDFNQIHNLLEYRKKYGYLISAFELSVIEGFTPEVVTSLTPFINYELPSDSIANSGKILRNSLITRMKASFPQPKGYRSSSANKGATYPGLPFSAYSRYRFEMPGNYEVGLVMDHDAGEKFLSGNNKTGFDYYSGFISFKRKGFLRQLTIGDFLLKVGQGVSFGGGSGLGKSANTMGILKFGQTLKPYTSSDENRFFRGASAVLAHGPLTFVVFYSNKNRDANILTDSKTGDKYFSSLQTSGYHRTLSEIEDKRSINEQLGGGYGEVRFDRFKIGGLIVFQQFSLPMATGSSAYKQKSFAGRNNLNLGIEYQLALSHIQCFGEAGMSKNGRVGGVQGIVWHTTPQLSLSAYFRFFDPGFHAFYGSSLSESSGNRNETGLYIGLLFCPFPKIKIFGYADVYHFPMLTYSTTAPVSGSDFMVQSDITFTRKFTLSLKGKYESKPQKTTVSKGVTADTDERLTKLRIQSDFNISQKLALHNRFEYAGYNFNQIHEIGFLAFQDIIYSPWKKLKFWLRYAWFNTDGYNSRIYCYENDLLYSFSIPEFHGSGSRLYINLRWSPSSRITTYLKVGYTLHNGVSSWGSGNDITDGNQRFEVRGLLNWRF